MSELARRYARALYECAPEERPLHDTADALMACAPLWEALCSPAVRREEKCRVLDRLPLLEGQEYLLRFYRLLARKGRMALLPQIVAAFDDCVLEEKESARCVLTCTHLPDAREVEQLRRAMCRLHHKKDVIFDIRRDPSLLGGFVLEMEGVTYDKSVRGALRDLTRQLEERQAV